MKIGFFGDGPWAERALLPLLQDTRYTIVFVAVRASRPDRKLVEMAKSRGIPLLCPASVNSDESLAEIAGFGADLHVSMSYDQILRERILAVPPRGTLNCHAGALPFYRGRNPLTWAIINGETEIGITVHLGIPPSWRNWGARTTLRAISRTPCRPFRRSSNRTLSMHR